MSELDIEGDGGNVAVRVASKGVILASDKYVARLVIPTALHGLIGTENLLDSDRKAVYFQFDSDIYAR